MKKLNLPVFKKPMLEPKPLSMDQYFKFVMFNIKNIEVDKKFHTEWKKKTAVNVPFKLY